jgi:hypothetical protein
MNSFTIPLRCHQRNAPMTIACAFWPGVCGLHHLGFPQGLSVFYPKIDAKNRLIAEPSHQRFLNAN